MFRSLVVQVVQSVGCVSVCQDDNCLTIDGLWTRYLICWFMLTLSRLCSKVKVISQWLRSQEKNDLCNCWDGRVWLKSRPEMKTVNVYNSQSKIFQVEPIYVVLNVTRDWSLQPQWCLSSCVIVLDDSVLWMCNVFHHMFHHNNQPGIERVQVCTC